MLIILIGENGGHGRQDCSAMCLIITYLQNCHTFHRLGTFHLGLLRVYSGSLLESLEFIGLSHFTTSAFDNLSIVTYSVQYPANESHTPRDFPWIQIPVLSSVFVSWAVTCCDILRASGPCWLLQTSSSWSSDSPDHRLLAAAAPIFLALPQLMSGFKFCAVFCTFVAGLSWSSD